MHPIHFGAITFKIPARYKADVERVLGENAFPIHLQPEAASKVTITAPVQEGDQVTFQVQTLNNDVNTERLVAFPLLFALSTFLAKIPLEAIQTEPPLD